VVDLPRGEEIGHLGDELGDVFGVHGLSIPFRGGTLHSAVELFADPGLEFLEGDPVPEILEGNQLLLPVGITVVGLDLGHECLIEAIEVDLVEFHGSTLPRSGVTLHSVGKILQVLDELHLELEERPVVRIVAEVDGGVQTHPLPDGVEAFEDELRFGAGEVFHGSSIPRSGVTLHRLRPGSGSGRQPELS